jgi:hypothetical protein
MTTPNAARPGRNEPCHCGSGLKYKRCCLEKDEKERAAARAKAAAEATASAAAAPAPAAADVAPKAARTPTAPTKQPWKSSSARPFVGRARTPRKVGGS